MQVRKTRAISVDLEHCAPAPERTAAISRRPIQGVAAARYSQTGIRISSIAVGETMQSREGLRRHPALQHPAETGYQPHGRNGQERSPARVNGRGTLLAISAVGLKIGRAHV